MRLKLGLGLGLGLGMGFAVARVAAVVFSEVMLLFVVYSWQVNWRSKLEGIGASRYLADRLVQQVETIVCRWVSARSGNE